VVVSNGARGYGVPRSDDAAVPLPDAGRTRGVKVRDVIRLIEVDGWRFERQRGSHRIYRHPEKPGTVTVAGQRGKDIPIGTLESIIW
jgi:predicted RNA binding protein YcfA (HicA-like mRNA interferase family)